MSVELLDANEFSPEFERNSYAVQLAPAGAGEPALKARRDEPEAWCPLLTVRANDQDCSHEFGQVCRYELMEGAAGAAGLWPLDAQTLASKLSVDAAGRLAARCSWLAGLQEPARLVEEARNSTSGPTGAGFHFQLVAFDCGGKKSQTPAAVHVSLGAGQPAGAARKCRPAWKGK